MVRKRLPVRRPYDRIRVSVCNQSARSTEIRAIVIHTTESHDRQGLSDLQGVVNWFDNPQSQASSHVIIDAEGYSAKCVDDSKKAWTCGQFNSQTLNIELIGWASLKRWQWIKRERQLNKCAKYLAFWSKAYAIPLSPAKISGNRITRNGVTFHMDLGQAGGGHHDPGPDFPRDVLLRKARYYLKEGWPK